MLGASVIMKMQIFYRSGHRNPQSSCQNAPDMYSALKECDYALTNRANLLYCSLNAATTRKTIRTTASAVILLGINTAFAFF